ncbi:MAG: hypothetical protein KDD41_00270 [Flavobacteriales bacterium]|nr:hypothetical protein [Flavobacteriales bacterium]
MSEQDLKYFELLKQEVAKTLQKSYSVNPDIKNWKGQDITFLQDDLSDKVNGRISEKWFYTHMKSDGGKLPRIDMLNIFSEYTGFQNWNDFKSNHTIEHIKLKPAGKKKNRSFLKIIVPVIIITITVTAYLMYPRTHTYTFCFVDANLKAPIKNSPIWIVVLNNDESPLITQCDSSGCFSLQTKHEQIQFVVRSPYYKTDTITRIVHNKALNEEQIQLKTNDYALMIHLYSTSKVTNWRKRRKQLGSMLTDDARIYQLYEDGVTGMELYNKSEFIDKLTTPTKGLKNIEIIETIYTGDKISILRFKQTADHGV